MVQSELLSTSQMRRKPAAAAQEARFGTCTTSTQRGAAGRRIKPQGALPSHLGAFGHRRGTLIFYDGTAQSFENSDFVEVDPFIPAFGVMAIRFAATTETSTRTATRHFCPYTVF
jgi:hypothetical protein